MKYTTDKNEKYVVITLEEEKLDSGIAPALKSELVIFNAEGYRNIILDLSRIKEVDSSGLSSLLTGYRACQQAGGSFVLTAVQPAVEKLITISQLDRDLQIIPTLDEAIDYIYMEEVERELKKGDQ